MTILQFLVGILAALGVLFLIFIGLVCWDLAKVQAEDP